MTNSVQKTKINANEKYFNNCMPQVTRENINRQNTTQNKQTKHNLSQKHYLEKAKYQNTTKKKQKIKTNSTVSITTEKTRHKFQNHE